VYDGSKIKNVPNLFINDPNIKEYIFEGEGVSGNPQRNYALTKITNPNTLLYYLDDDNIIHPAIYKLLNVIDSNKLYTFNQLNRLKGDTINVGSIDTAMYIIPYNLFKMEKWIINCYSADGHYIKECYDKNKKIHVYLDNDLCYYNKIKN
jgi:hypothetical protein